MCTIVYNDRINTYNKMKVLDVKLDEAPQPDDVREMAETRIRNLQSFAELKHYNEKGIFSRQHPIVINQLEYKDLTKLWFSDRDAFFSRHRCCLNNIYRYKGRLEGKLPAEKRLKYELLLDKHTSRSTIFESIVNGNFFNPYTYERHSLRNG